MYSLILLNKLMEIMEIMEEDFVYTLKKSGKAKRIRLSVYRDGKVVVTVPKGLPATAAENFVFAKKDWVIKKIRFFKSADVSAVRVLSRKDYLENKNEALCLVNDRLSFYNRIYGFSFDSVSIKDQRTRWGSCSRRGRLNFNYKILFLPDKLRDYIIVHEICHLKEFNHSPEFWSLVRKAFPDCLEIRKELRRQELLYN
jgi:predicted metal-dependent hydrolase